MVFQFSKLPKVQETTLVVVVNKLSKMCLASNCFHGYHSLRIRMAFSANKNKQLTFNHT